MSIAVIYGGSRSNGNTETLTQRVIEGSIVETIHLKDYEIKPIVDQRHAKGGFSEVHDDYNSLIDKILKHDILIFVTPIYWYSMTSIMKVFIDRWSQTLRDSNYPDFKNRLAIKKAYVIAVGGDNPYIKGLPMIQQFKQIFDFVGLRFEGYIIGEGNKPDDILQDQRALSAAMELKKELLLTERTS